jgi:membrane protein DedA with SNARE-associated domain
VIWYQLNGRLIIWPLLLSALWGLAVIGHGVSYYQGYGKGAKRREQKLEREVEAIYHQQHQNGDL